MFGRESRRCSMCGINYPVAQICCDVNGCGEKLLYNGNAVPDDDWRDKVRTMNEAQEMEVAPDPDGLRAHRVKQYERLGFPDWAAALLADARDDLGFVLYWGKARDLLRNGATHAQVLRIFF